MSTSTPTIQTSATDFDPEAIVADFFDAFETDPERRLDRIREVFADDIDFCDNIHDITGVAALDEMGQWINGQFPDAVIRREGKILSHHRQVTFAWTMTSADGALIVSGRDVLLIGADSKITHDYSFLEFPES